MSTVRRKPYPFSTFEPKWQQHWDQAQTFHAPNPGEPGFDPAKPKYYVLDMFPYPSGAGLHVGHPEGYTATDILARYKRMRGCNVLHPMGWDAFGLPAEQYAIKTGQHPSVTTARNVAHFKGQLQRLGFAYDWQREVNTTDPGYFRWTQWIFLQLYEAWFNPDTQRAEPVSTYKGADVDSVRLAYVSEAPVNWCPALGTVLANEEVIDGKSEVGGHPVERRPMRQWMLRITAYAQRLIDELEGLDWPTGIKLLQQNWIGRSEGAEVVFMVAQASGLPAAEARKPEACATITVFTTRPDTLFGATYMVLAPEHPLVERLVTEEQWPEVRAYREKTARKSDLERTELAKEKSGVWTGAFAVNPVNGERIPIWIADYVLLGYGTGAIMAVPAHDERDWEFACKYGLRIRSVVQPTGTWLKSTVNVEAIVGLPRAEFAATNLNDPAQLRLLATRYASATGSEDGSFCEECVCLLQKVTGSQDATEEDLDTLRFCYSEAPACFGLGVGSGAYKEEGTLINSEIFNDLPTAEAKVAIIGLLEKEGWGKKTINFKLRDWLFSRQRYWGEPFPIVWEDGQHRALPASELPLTPPAMTDFKPTGTSEPPLAKATDWLRYSEKATRETNTMPQWAGSCWYYLRYCDAQNAERFVGAEAERYWMGGGGEKDEGGRMKDEIRSAAPSSSSFILHPSSFSPQPGGVDLYVGGTEHAVLHLLYARFWHKVLHDLGHVSTPEPFQRLVNQGLILGEDGQKMSKSRGNVVNPDDVIAEYGADALRGYLMFMGPLEATKPWSMTGVEGITRFLARVWRLVMEEQQDGSWALGAVSAEAAPDKAQLRVIHASIKKVTADIEALSFNTALSQLMVCTNAFVNVSPRPLSAVRTLLTLLNPFAPHLTEELWENLAQRFGDAPGQLADAAWPQWDERLLIDDEMEIVIQVNAKVRDKMVVPKDATREAVEAQARGSAKIAEWTAGKEIKKVIVVPGKLVNIVVA